MKREGYVSPVIRDIQKRILEGYRKGWSTEKVLKSLRDEDADAVGEAWMALKRRRKLPKTASVRAFVVFRLRNIANEL